MPHKRRGQRPEHQICKQRNVLPERLFGCARDVSAMNEEEIAEDPVQHEGDRHHHGVVVRDRAGEEGVEGVADDRGAGHDGDQVVEKGTGVLLQIAAMAGGTVFQEQNLMSTLAEAKKEGEQDGTEIQPGRDLHANDGCPGGGSKDESTGDGKNIDDNQVLEIEGVGRHQDGVAGRHQCKRCAEQNAEPHREKHQNNRNEHRGPNTDTPGSYGPVSLDRMQAVRLDIGGIVEQVDAGGEGAKEQEGCDRLQNQIGMCPLGGKDERGENKGVLDPLLGPHGAKQVERKGRFPPLRNRRLGQLVVRHEYSKSRHGINGSSGGTIRAVRRGLGLGLLPTYHVPVDITTAGSQRVRAGDGRRGLEGVTATASAVSSIIDGKLTYCGYDIDELAEHSSFEETVYLLWTGNLPTETEFQSFREQLSAAERLQPEVIDLLRGLPPSGAPMELLRTAVSALSLHDGRNRDSYPDVTHQEAVRILARFPALVAAIHRLRVGQDAISPDPDLPLAANFLTMLTGKRPSDLSARILDEVLILHADHELNASTFTARVAASTLTDMNSAVVAALCALNGSLHGGAAERVYGMLAAISNVESVRPWLHAALERKERIMGFGHRVYKEGDPRARRLKRLSERLASESGDRRWYEVSARLEGEVATTLGLMPNVDFYSASVYTYLGIPPELFPPIFAMSRVAGWIAHIMEQYADNRLIRPRAEYVGHGYRTYVGMENR